MGLACAVAAAVAIGAALAGAPGPAQAQAGEKAGPHDAAVPAITIAIVPHGTELGRLARVRNAAVGLLSPGISSVPSLQTYLDITQGNRVSSALYKPRALPALGLALSLPGSVAPAVWREITERADGAPADVVPGLLGSTLERSGIPVLADYAAGTAALIAADTAGEIAPAGSRTCAKSPCPGLLVTYARPGGLDRLIERQTGDDLLIAIERPPPEERLLTMIAAGRGFERGRLTSDSTRTPGLVAASDLAPTILDRFGIEQPGEMNGEPMRAAGDAEAAAEVEALLEFENRLEQTGPRRGPVVGQNLLLWLAALALAGLARGRAGFVTGMRLLAPTIALLPLVLLLTASLYPSLAVERVIVGLGTPLLAAALVAWAPGWRALGIAASATVVAFAADLVAGTDLITRSLIGPNPASGSRFYGIGNEVEATLGALLPVGVGALLAASPSLRAGGRRAALAFAVTGLIATGIFAAGRFGADVGAAFVFPTAAAAGAVVALGSRRNLALLVLAPAAGLGLIAAVDLIGGGGSHLTRSVFEAGGLEQAGDVFERRLRLAARTFQRGSNAPFLMLAAVLAGLGFWRRRSVRSWFPERTAWAGLVGAIAATAIGTLTNDSGAILLILGSGYVAATVGYAWANHQATQQSGHERISPLP